MYRTDCGSCGSVGSLNLFLDLGATPLADRFPESRDAEEEKWPLRVALCERCKLVQLMDIVPDGTLYGADYAYYTGAARSHSSYWDSYANDLVQRVPPGSPATTGHTTSVLEIACNDGSLLTRLHARGYDVTGVDPATGPLSQIPDEIPTYALPFNSITAQKVLDNHGQFDVVVANNVLAHVSDMNDFCKALSLVTHRNSLVVIEVQYLGDLVTGNQFDHFYHEHRSFFSLRTLERLLIPNGFTISDVIRTHPQGGSIRVFASKGALFTYPQKDSYHAMKAGESWLDEWFTMESLVGRVDHIRDTLLEMLEKVHEFPDVVAGYGATAKSCTLLNYCGIDNSTLDWVVDTTPWKQGKFTPGSRIPVVAPKDEPTKPDVYLLLAWNYLPAILRQESMFLFRGGQFLVPLPKPVLL